MDQREYEMYQKAVGFIINNLSNPDFTAILRQNGYKIIPCKLSFIIENLEKAGYTVTKNSAETQTQTERVQPIITFDKENFFNTLKSNNLSLYTLIKDADIFLSDNNLTIIFDKNSFFKYKQVLDTTNNKNLTKFSCDFLNQEIILNINIKRD